MNGGAEKSEIREKNRPRKDWRSIALSVMAFCGGEFASTANEPQPSVPGALHRPQSVELATPVRELDQMFAPRNGWAGADGAYSMELTQGRRAWLFSDTWISKIEGSRRVESRMINNSVGISEANGSVGFFHRVSGGGAPDSVFKPSVGVGFYWIFGGTAHGSTGWIFLQRVRTTDDRSAFGFEVMGTELARVANIQDPPGDWRKTVRPITFSGKRPGSHRIFGSALARSGDELVVYGVEMATTNRPFGMLVAKVHVDQAHDESQWRFFDGRRWSRSEKAIRPILDSVPTEFSVHRAEDVPGTPWVLTYMEGGIFGNILMRLSPSPTGPWSEPVRVFECPEKTRGEGVFCYSAKAHPGFQPEPGRVIVSYCANAPKISTVLNDTALYRPRFVRVDVEEVARQVVWKRGETGALGRPQALTRAELRWKQR